MLGMSLATFTILHVLTSLIGIVAGLIAMIGWLKSDPSRVPTARIAGRQVDRMTRDFRFWRF
jgi:hypothetical protein